MAALLPSCFENVISDAELAEAQAEYPMIRRKEELYYFRILTELLMDVTHIEIMKKIRSKSSQSP